jgi:hypothetical protein
MPVDSRVSGSDNMQTTHPPPTLPLEGGGNVQITVSCVLRTVSDIQQKSDDVSTVAFLVYLFLAAQKNYFFK